MKREDKLALDEIYSRKRGLMPDLKRIVSQEIIDKLISVGFIICGYNKEAKTWRLSSLGEEYYEDLFCNG